MLFGSDQALGELLSKRFDLGYIAIRRSLTNEIIAAGADASAIASKLVS
jgi:hypothetical protein